jgi:phospholipid/cholesterol/gamma-HCH transport system ATP-binding protein
MLDSGDPKELLHHSQHEKVRQFLSRAGTAAAENQ